MRAEPPLPTSKSNAPIVEDRVVAFLDVLGFRQLVALLDASDGSTPQPLAGVADVFNWVASWEGTLAGSNQESVRRDIQLCHFSDSILVSERRTGAGAMDVLLVAGTLAHVFLRAGMLLRGAIVCGLAHHRRAVAFGPAIVRAYDLESQEAIYPRIVIDEDVPELLDPALGPILRRDPDGWHSLNSFAFAWLGGPPHGLVRDRPYPPLVRHRGGNVDIMTRFRTALEQAHAREADLGNRAGVLSKILWAVGRFNDTLDDFEIEVPRLELP